MNQELAKSYQQALRDLSETLEVKNDVTCLLYTSTNAKAAQYTAEVCSAANAVAAGAADTVSYTHLPGGQSAAGLPRHGGVEDPVLLGPYHHDHDFCGPLPPILSDDGLSLIHI